MAFETLLQIKKKKKECMIKELFKLNCSTLFLLHPLGLSRKQLQGTGFINCYLRDKNKPEYEGLNVVFMLFLPKAQDKFRYFTESEKARTPLFIDQYDLEDGYTVMVYELPENMADDFELFKQGKYSQLSDTYLASLPKQVAVPTKNGYQTSNTVQWMIIGQLEEWRDLLETEFNAPVERDTEMWQKMSWEDETISIPPKKIAPEK
jgi:hypothetical protein